MPKPVNAMKMKSNKLTQARAASLAAEITAREAVAAEDRAEVARIHFKNAKKAHKLARKAAKRAVRRAKQAEERLAVFLKSLPKAKQRTR